MRIARNMDHNSFPLVVAQLCSRSENAKTPLERHQAAFYSWEVLIKTIGMISVVSYASAEERDKEIDTRLHNLARPSLGHWWEFVRLLAPFLAHLGDTGFDKLHSFLASPPRDDLPAMARMDAALLEAIEGERVSRSTVEPKLLIDHFITYRNTEVGHGAVGRKSDDYYNRMAEILLDAVCELMGAVDILAGHRMVWVQNVGRLQSGSWRIDHLELVGDVPKRLEPIELEHANADSLPRPEEVCIIRAEVKDGAGGYVSLHPLVHFDVDTNQSFLLKSRKGRAKIEYLSYVSGRSIKQKQYADEHRELLARLLRLPVDKEELVRGDQDEYLPAPTMTSTMELSKTQQVGEYFLVSKLGSGGMGDVYRAVQPSLRRQVALKCMRKVGDGQAQLRFSREIRALGCVEHPHLVKIYSSGADADRWFYAMELVEGSTLQQIQSQLIKADASSSTITLSDWRDAVETACALTLEQQHSISQSEGLCEPSHATGDSETQRQPNASVPRRFSSRQIPGDNYVAVVVELMRQIADAAGALHANQIVHRDIKPGNIIVSSDGKHAVLMDLGLAKFADEEGDATKTRQFVGSVHYASPEQVLSARHADCRSDVYSLGVILWELLSLRSIYGIDGDTSTPEIMRRVETVEPEWIRKYQPSIPVELEAIVFRCLEKSRERRYPSALELSADLNRWQEGEPVHAKRRSSIEKVRRHLVVNWRGWGVVGVAAVLLLTLIGALSRERIDPYVFHRQREIDAQYRRITRSPPEIVRDPHPNRQWVGQLEDDNEADFEVIEHQMVWDLRAWKPVIGESKDMLISPASTYQRKRLRKTRDTQVFATQARTTGADVFTRSPDDGRALQVLASNAPAKVGGLVMKARQAIFDVADVPVGREFTLATTRTYWNGFRDEDDLWVGAMVKNGSYEKVSFLLIVPTEKPIQSYHLRAAEIDGDGVENDLGQQFIFEDPDGRYLFWEVANPKQNHVYQIYWKWVW